MEEEKDCYLAELSGGKPSSLGLTNIAQNRQNFAQLALVLRANLADAEDFDPYYCACWDAKDAIGALYASQNYCPAANLPPMPAMDEPDSAATYVRSMIAFVAAVKTQVEGHPWFESMRVRAIDKLSILADMLRD